MKELHKDSSITSPLIIADEIEPYFRKEAVAENRRIERDTTCCIMWVIAPGEDAGIDFTTTEVCVAVCD